MKKKNYFGIAAIFSLLLGGLLFTACSSSTNGGGGTTTLPVEVKILYNGQPVTSQINADKGDELTFTVEVTNAAVTTVTWSVTGGKQSTSITNGLLAISGDEDDNAILTVKAVSTADTAKSATVTVKVRSGGGGTPIVFGDLEMYKGGARPGLEVVPLNDYPWYSHTSTGEYWAGTLNENWDVNITLEAAGEGHNGGAAIKAGKYAGNPDTGFGLALNDFVDMSEVKALSFWAKADSGTFNIWRVGFGDEGTYAGWAGTHSGVMYIGENHDSKIPVNDTWQHFIVPVPPGCTAPAMSRIFTIVATIPEGNFLLIDNIEFITTGVTCTGIKVPNNKTGVVVGADVNVSTLFRKTETAWTFKLDSDNSVWSIYMATDAWVHLNGWTLPANYDKFTVASVGGTNKDDVTVSGDNLTISTDVGLAEITLVLKNGQNLQTNQIALAFDEAGKMLIQDLGAISSGLWVNGWWTGYGEEKGDRACFGAILGAQWYGAVGCEDFNPPLDISQYETITFSIWVDSEDSSPIGNTFEFGIDCGAVKEEYYMPSFIITNAMDKTWTKLSFKLADFKTRGDEAITTEALQNFKAWRFAGVGDDEWTTHGAIWFDKIEALKD